MRAPPPPLLLLVVAAAATAAAVNDSTDLEPTNLHNTTFPIIEDDAALEAENGTVVRKKRTFGDLVFRGLADVLGYNVARKPTVFPPPLAPVPGIDAPLQAGPAPPPPPPPCPTPAPRAAPPCARPKPPPPPPPPPCAKPRAVPRPKPKPTPKPPPPPPPPCPRPRANPKTTPKPSPCAPPPPPPPPAKPKADAPGTVSSNFRLSFNFNRSPSAPAAEETAEEPVEAEQEQEEVIADPIVFRPRAATLPVAEERVPRVYVDAFVVRDGVAQRAHTLDAASAGLGAAADRSDEYVTDDDQSQQEEDDVDYEDSQESRGATLKQVDNTVQKGRRQQQRQKRPLQPNPEHYSNVHFGDRQLVRDIQNHASAEEGDNEPLTTTEDPRRTLRPRVLPPTEHNPNQIDTVTVRVPPIYREKRPRKLHREKTPRPYDDHAFSNEEYAPQNHDSNGEQSASLSRDPEPTPTPPRRRRKKIRHKRSAQNEYTAGDYAYFDKKLPVSKKEEEMFQRLTVAPLTRDADLARIEEEPAGYFLDDHERLTDDPERTDDDEQNEDSQDSEREDDKERYSKDEERAGEAERLGEDGRADERERSDLLSPEAHVRESGYQKKYLRESNLQVDDDSPRPPPRNKLLALSLPELPAITY